MATDTSSLRKLFVHDEETVMRLMEQYWDSFEDATLVPDKEPYWVITMKRPRRRQVAELRGSASDNDLSTFAKKQESKT
jgi:hypothetical protein